MEFRQIKLPLIVFFFFTGINMLFNQTLKPILKKEALLQF